MLPSASSINSLTSQHPHAGAPVFVDIESIKFNVGCDRLCQRRERWMEAQRGRDQIDQRRFITDLAIPKKFRAADMAATTMRLHAPPVIDALKNVLAIFADL